MVAANEHGLTDARLGDIPELYFELLERIREAASQLEIDPYESVLGSFGKAFSPRYQVRFWSSRFLVDFLKTSNAFRQELPLPPIYCVN